MRTVLKSNTETIKTFNKQSQSHGRGGNLFFEGYTLYSYGYHYPLAMFVESDTILINNEGFSNTTARHIYKTKCITDDRKQLFTTEVCLSLVLNEMENLHYKLSKARKPIKYAEQINKLFHDFSNSTAHMRGFYVKTKGHFRGVSFDLVRLNEATPQQIESLGRIYEIYNNALKFL